jgi:hypothetical protein
MNLSTIMKLLIVALLITSIFADHHHGKGKPKHGKDEHDDDDGDKPQSNDDPASNSTTNYCLLSDATEDVNVYFNAIQEKG